MSSTNKTTNLNLNQWEGTDRSQRTDFNEDNKKIDAWAGEVNSQLNERIKDLRIISKKIVSSTADNPVKIKILGDSIAAGSGGTGYSCTGDIIYGTYKENTNGHCWANSFRDFVQSKFNCICKNWGIGGFKSSDIANNLDKLISSDDDIILCAIGANNCYIANGVEIFKNDIRTIYNYVKNLNKEIVFIGTIQTQVAESCTIKMEDIDNALMEVCTDLCIDFIPMYNLFNNFIITSGSPKDIFYANTEHPNNNGYDVMFNLITNYMKLSTDMDTRNSLLKIVNTDWINLVLEGDATEYVSGRSCKYRRSGNFVEVKGSMKGLKNINTTAVQFSTLPSGFRPYEVGYFIAHGSGACNWLLRIDPDGSMYADRYSSDTVSGTEWLTFNAVFSI